MMDIHIGYHDVVESNPQGLAVSTDQFRERLEKIKQTDGKVITVDEWLKRKQNHLTLEGRFTFSFDDGLKGQYENAFPILQEFGFQGTFYIITCVIDGAVPGAMAIQQLIKKLGADGLLERVKAEFGKDVFYSLFFEKKFSIGICYGNEPKEVRLVKTILNYGLPHNQKDEFILKLMVEVFGVDGVRGIIEEMFMSKENIQEIQRAGMEIGNHTHSHPFFPHLSQLDIVTEVGRAGQMLEDIGCPKSTFCYSFGGLFSESTMSIVRDNGYCGACNFRYADDVDFGEEGDFNIFRVPG